MATHEITKLLLEFSDKPQEISNKLLPLIYDELKKIASNYLRRERIGHTLQPTALVHEAYLKLINQTQISWQNKTHFWVSRQISCGGFWLITGK